VPGFCWETRGSTRHTELMRFPPLGFSAKDVTGRVCHEGTTRCTDVLITLDSCCTKTIEWAKNKVCMHHKTPQKHQGKDIRKTSCSALYFCLCESGFRSPAIQESGRGHAEGLVDSNILFSCYHPDHCPMMNSMVCNKPQLASK